MHNYAVPSIRLHLGTSLYVVVRPESRRCVAIAATDETPRPEPESTPEAEVTSETATSKKPEIDVDAALQQGAAALSTSFALLSVALLLRL